MVNFKLINYETPYSNEAGFGHVNCTSSNGFGQNGLKVRDGFSQSLKLVPLSTGKN